MTQNHDRSARAWVVAGLMGLVLFHLALGAAVRIRDRMPPFLDGAFYYQRATALLDAPRPGGLAWPTAAVKAFLDVDQYRPPLFMALSALSMGLLGRSPDAMAAANLPFLIILLLSTFFMSIHLGASRRVSLLTAALVSLTPQVAAFSRMTWLDFGLTSLCALAWLATLKSRGFSRRPWALALGAALGLGLLQKWSIALYAMPLLAIEGSRGLWAARASGRLTVTIVNILLAAAVAALIAGPWYLPNLSIMLHAHSQLVGSDLYFKGGPLDGLLFYGRYLPQLLGPALILLPLCALALRRGKTERLLALALVALPLGLLLLISAKDPRFLLPPLVATVMLVGLAMGALRRLSTIVPLASLAALALYLLVLGLGLDPQRQDWKEPFVPFTGLLIPRDQDWQGQEIHRTMDRLPHIPSRPDLLVVLPNIPPLSSPLHTLKKGWPRIIYIPGEVDMTHSGPPNIPFLLGRADLVLTKEGEQGNPGYLGTVIPEAQALFRTFEGRFQEVAHFDLPDGTKAHLWQSRCLRYLASDGLMVGSEPLERAMRGELMSLAGGQGASPNGGLKGDLFTGPLGDRYLALLAPLNRATCGVVTDRTDWAFRSRLAIAFDPRDADAQDPTFDTLERVLGADYLMMATYIDQEALVAPLSRLMAYVKAHPSLELRGEIRVGRDRFTQLFRREGAPSTLRLDGGNLTRGNVGPGGAFGDDLLVDQKAYPNVAEWDFTLPHDGEYEVWVKVAGGEERGVDVLFDGRLWRKDGLTHVTGGWASAQARWFVEGTVRLGRGDHTLRLESPMLPHLAAVGLVKVSKARQDFIMVRAKDMAQGNLQAGENWGAEIMVNGGATPNWAEYAFHVRKGGEFELWARYAAKEQRECNLALDGAPWGTLVMGHTTGGWTEGYLKWFREAKARLKPGRHLVRITCPMAPHLAALALRRAGEGLQDEGP